MNRRRAIGLTRAGTVVIVLVGLFLIVCVPPAARHLRRSALRAGCARNLSRIAKAMLAYANDHDGWFPRAGGFGTMWGAGVVWDAPDRYQAYGLARDGSGGQATISSCFYLLVKYGHVTPEAFVCRGDAGATPFRLSQVAGPRAGFELADAWDFGPEPYGHCSYAYHFPFNLYALNTSCDPGMAVAADRSPWQAMPTAERPDINQFRPDLPGFNGSREQARRGNSPAHRRDGQNVLFADGHVSFEKRPWCGLDDDNIYTIATNQMTGDPLGTMPPMSQFDPMNRKDTVLVNDPVVEKAETVTQADAVDSRNLHRTGVVATLDCPLPEHKNAIWCATFQMAWDRLKDDVIGAAIQVPAAANLVGRLNQGAFPLDDIEPESYYVFAGRVEDGALEQIQREMKRRFPSEPPLVFSKGYRTLPEAIAGYAYLNVDVGFAHPFYAHRRAFSFKDSNGASTDVTAFSAQSGTPHVQPRQVREQVEILYWKYGETAAGDEFAVDLSRHTQPYQVILARLPGPGTLGGAAHALREGMAEFPNDPNYETLRRLRSIDTLIVPDVLFKLTHHFDELLDKSLANEDWQIHFFFEAMQKIDFTLSRTGVILRSEARLASARRGELGEPRRLHFNRPFLICVRKRTPDATPFFLMWVDNPELMRPYEATAPERR